jgi:hypothetical protein
VTVGVLLPVGGVIEKSASARPSLLWFKMMSTGMLFSASR